MNLDVLGQLSSIVAAAVAIVGLPMILLQLEVAMQQQRDAIKLSGSQILLAADAVLVALEDISEISRKLRPGGEWHRSAEHPTDDEMPLVEPYLGVFERLWVAYSISQIDAATINHLYGYRIKNIWANPRLVKEKLQNEERRHGWWMFISLTYELEKGERFWGHTDDWQPTEWLLWRAQKKKGKIARAWAKLTAHNNYTTNHA